MASTTSMHLLEQICFAVHAWDKRRGLSVGTQVARIKTELIKRNITLPVIVSEYNITSNREWSGSLNATSIGRSGNDPRRDPEYVARLINSILEMRVQGASAIILWEFADPSWGRDRFGLIDIHGTPTASLATLKSLSRLAHGRRIRALLSDCGSTYEIRDDQSNVFVGVIANFGAEDLQVNLIGEVHCDCAIRPSDERKICSRSNKSTYVRIKPGSFAVACQAE